MRRFLMISALTLLMGFKAWACGDFGSTHNYYMFKMFPDRKSVWDDERLTQFWKDYAGKDVYNYEWQHDDILEAAKKKNDTEMLAYIKLLDQYLENSGEISNGWDYPTEEELNKQGDAMKSILQSAKAYNGTRLRQQYSLLVMRANMQLEKHADNKAYWENTASKLSDSAYREIMKNIYAGALLRLGERSAAWDLYAEQGDYVSLRWSAFKYRNLAGIKTIFADHPNSPVINYLVQDFVNSAQETLDQQELGKGSDFIDKEWIEDEINRVGANPIYIEEVRQFITFADDVVKGKRSQYPCMWKTATGMLHYLLGEYDTALSDLDQAMKLDGTQRMKDNTRCIRLLASTGKPEFGKKYSNYVTKELQWLEGNLQKDDYYQFAWDRIVHLGLANTYKKAGNTSLAMALIGMKVNNESGSDADDSWNPNYMGEYYYNAIENATAEQILAYYQYLTSNPKDALEKYVLGKVSHDTDYFNDLIGTKYIAQGNFTEAIKYLEKVPLSFIEHQNISWYMGNRDYTREPWFGERENNGFESGEDGPAKAKITVNKKLAFCKEMQQLQSRHLLAGDAAVRKQLAYDIAVRFFQASFKGDCWFLTHYGWSSGDEQKKNEKDFIQAAITYLTECKTANDFALKEKSLYALAYIPLDEWQEYSWEVGEFVAKKNSRQYAALKELSDFKNQNLSQVSEYISKCDVLVQFMKNEK